MIQYKCLALSVQRYSLEKDTKEREQDTSIFELLKTAFLQDKNLEIGYDYFSVDQLIDEFTHYYFFTAVEPIAFLLTNISAIYLNVFFL